MAKTLSLVKFTAKLHRPAEGGDWSFVYLPQEASDQMPARSMVAVEGSLNGFAFSAALEPDNKGGHWLKIEKAWSQAANVAPGDEVDFEIRPAAVEPEPVVPEDLLQALGANPVALSAWNDTTAVARRDWITWMCQGKLAETRHLRLEKMMNMLEHGKRRVCCFDRSGMASKAFFCPTPADS